MSNERPTDDDVSRAYRELADERTPERLDAAVLRQAAKASRPQYARSIRWTRPLAWAATITLCLALTLQFAQLPTPGSVQIPTVQEPATKDEAQAPDGMLRQDAPAAAVDVDSAPQDKRVSPSKLAEAESKLSADRDQQTGVGSMYSGSDDALEDTLQNEQVSIEEALSVNAGDREIVDRARELARTQKAAVPESAAANAPADAKQSATAAPALTDTTALSAAAPAEGEVAARRAAAVAYRASDQVAEPLEARSEDDAVDADCDEDERETAASWQACIDALQEAGDFRAAERQRGLLKEAFSSAPTP